MRTNGAVHGVARLGYWQSRVALVGGLAPKACVDANLLAVIDYSVVCSRVRHTEGQRRHRP